MESSSEVVREIRMEFESLLKTDTYVQSSTRARAILLNAIAKAVVKLKQIEGE